MIFFQMPDLGKKHCLPQRQARARFFAAIPCQAKNASLYRVLPRCRTIFPS
jgi:hypothetical protein